MLTQLELNNDLIKKCMKLTGIKTEQALVDYALQEVLKRQQKMQALKLEGKVHWEGDLNTLRKGRQGL